MLSRKAGGGSVKANEPLRKGLASSSSETTTLSTLEPSSVVSTMDAVGLADDPRVTRVAPIGALVSTFENRSTAPAARRMPPQLKETLVSDPSAML